MKKHLILQNSSKPEKFTGRGGGKIPLPERDRSPHSQQLLEQIKKIKEVRVQNQDLNPYQEGYYVEFKSEPKFPLNLKSIETDGIELVSVRTDNDIEIATAFLNDKSLSKLESKVEIYQKENNVRTQKDGTVKITPKRQDLVESFSEVSITAEISSLWTDNIPFPNEDELIRWEVWLRAGENDVEREQILEVFRNAAESVRIQTSSKEIRFPESTVVLVQTTARQISQILYPLNILSELRKAVDTADFFIGLGRDDEREWSNDAVNRIRSPSNNAPAVCLLDTGVMLKFISKCSLL